MQDVEIDVKKDDKEVIWVFSWLRLLSRARIELGLVFIIALLTLLIPAEAKRGLLGLLITKPLFVTLGVLYAHVSRIFLFPYIDMSDLLEKHHWSGIIFMAVYYGVIIYAFSMGG